MAAFLVGSLALYLFLQLKASYFVYRLLSPLQVINFPWRMLTFIAPIGIVLVVIIADDLMRKHPGKALWGSVTGAWVGSLILLSPVVPISGNVVTPSFFPMSAFTAPKSIDYRTFNGYFVSDGDAAGPFYTVFFPKLLASNGREITATVALGSLYAQLHRSQDGAQSLSRVACKVLGPRGRPSKHSSSSSPWTTRRQRGSHYR